jgi:hypothetical protein
MLNLSNYGMGSGLDHPAQCTLDAAAGGDVPGVRWMDQALFFRDGRPRTESRE